jgi:cysteine-rich repeat protein
VGSGGGTGGTNTGGEGGMGGAPSTLCGNGDLDESEGEQCDDGNLVGGDGCDELCQVESTGPDDICPGAEVALAGAGEEPRTASVSGSTTSKINHYGSVCGGSGEDAVYVVTPDVTGLLTATVLSDYDAVLYARSACDDPTSELDCDDISASGGGDQISFQVAAQTPYFIFVDGYGALDGNFTLDIVVATAFCGNGVAESPEQCDDGAMVDGDGCSATCSIEPGGVADNCPGNPFFLSGPPDMPRSLSLLGDTTPLGTGITPSGCSGSGSNAVYAITPDIDGSMKIDFTATYDDATVHIRGECDTSTTQLDCVEATEPAQPLSMTIPVVSSTTYYVIADSQSSTKEGPYLMNIVVSPGACGNDVLDGGEQCDDGNALTGDGCAPGCMLEGLGGNNDVCPGIPLVLSGMPEQAVVTASTTGLAGNYTNVDAATCAKVVAAKDAVYSVTPSINGYLTATVAGQFDTAIHARTVCVTANTADQLGCVEAVDGNGPETIKFPVTAGNAYYLFVDAALAAGEGVFELAIKVTPSACGNAVIEGGEQCDDGNMADLDGCTIACQLEPPGANENCPGEEIVLVQQGDTYQGNIAAGTTNLAANITLNSCTSSLGRDAVYQITAPIDGVLVASVPTAAFNVSLGARSACADAASQITCSNASAGNGGEAVTFTVTQGTTYYLIVDAPTAAAFGSFNLLVSIQPPGCGDGLISAGEQCDDGNVMDNDGCSAGCQIEALVDNDVCPGHVINLTGSGTDPRVGVATTDTGPLAANYAGSCGGNTRDAVYVVTPDVAGTLTAKLTGNYQSVLYGRTACADAATQTGCDDTASVTGSRDISFAVNANTPYYLFVDGLSGSSGVSTLQVTVTP